MEIAESTLQSTALKFVVDEKGKVVGRAFLYLIKNDLHEHPYGLLEDVFIDEGCRGKGIGTKLLHTVLEKAKKIGCYKIIATSRFSRPKVHELYVKLGFVQHGLEFRMDFGPKKT